MLHTKSIAYEQLKFKIMKSLNLLAAFIGGAIAGTAIGILFAPEKGSDTRAKIAEALRRKGIKLSKKEFKELVDEIAGEVNPKDLVEED